MAEPASHEEPKGGLEARFQQVDDLQQLAAMQEEAEAPAFTIADRYEVVGTLGQGGMGTVYKARDTRLGRTVAIKTLHPQYLSRPEASQRFFREAQALATLNHPNVLTLYDYGQEGDVHYLVMELGGRDLARLISAQSAPLPISETLDIAEAVCKALEYAHGHGITHRDLKPGNVLIGRPDDPAQRAAAGDAPVVKVMDFGLAKIQGATTLTTPNAQLGTPQYMSPEQCLGQEADERSDLYSFGVILYELCTGVRPFDSDDARAVLTQHLNLAPVPPSAFNPELARDVENLILRLLEKDPTQRPHAATQVLASFAAIRQRIADEASGASPSSTQGPASTTSFLHRIRARTPLVGRHDVLDFLKSQYDAVAAGAPGHLFLVSGEPGVGKTRLVQELGLYARLRGGTFLEGRYLREGTAPYGPWIEPLSQAFKALDNAAFAQVVGEYQADLAPLFPELEERLGQAAAARQLAADAQRLRLFDGIAAVVRNLSLRAPLVLLMDDHQWATSLAVIAHVARRIGESRALLFGAYREQELNERPALVREWEELNRARLFTPIHVAPLTADETAQMVVHTFGGETAAQLRETLHSRTRGNPFFIEEVLRSLVERGAVRQQGAEWQVTDLNLVTIPESLKLAVDERVARLGEGARDVLIQASVLGREFSFASLAAMAGLQENTLLEYIDSALSARLVVDRSSPAEEGYAFVDDQVQEVLYNSITVARRRRYHLRAGQGLEQVYHDRLDRHLEQLARHFAEGNDPEKGADYAYRAGVNADRLYAWSRSIPVYRTALELWDELGGHLEQRAAVCERLGDACFKSTIDRHLAMPYFQRSLGFYEQLGDRRKQATIHSQIGRDISVGASASVQDVDQALEHLHAARTVLEELPESMQLGLVYLSLDQTYYYLLCRDDEALLWARKALDLGERIDRPVIVAQAHNHIGRSLMNIGEVAGGEEELDLGWSLASRHNLAYQADESRGYGSLQLGYLKNPSAALAWALRRPDYQTFLSAAVRLSQVQTYALLGDFQRGAELLRQLEGWSGLEGLVGYLCWPALLLLRQEDWDKAGRLLEQAAQRGRHPFVAERKGRLHLYRGEYAEAEAELLWALDTLRRGTNLLLQLNLLPILCELYILTGRLDEAEATLAEAQSLAPLFEGWGGLPGDVYLAEGMLRAAQGRWPQAEAAFLCTQETYQKYELRWDEAKLYYEWGCALTTPSPVQVEGDRSDRARELLGKAMEMWDAMGAGPWADRCRERLAEI